MILYKSKEVNFSFKAFGNRLILMKVIGNSIVKTDYKVIGKRDDRKMKTRKSDLLCFTWIKLGLEIREAIVTRPMQGMGPPAAAAGALKHWQEAVHIYAFGTFVHR